MLLVADNDMTAVYISIRSGSETSVNTKGLEKLRLSSLSTTSDSKDLSLRGPVNFFFVIQK